MITPTFLTWLRRYVIIASVIILGGLGWGVWRFCQVMSMPTHRGLGIQTSVAFTISLCPIILFVILLLYPWWRFGRIARSISLTIFLLSGTFATWASIWAALHGGQVLSSAFVVTAFTGHLLWLLFAAKSKSPNRL
jgi:hypothetical protein